MVFDVAEGVQRGCLAGGVTVLSLRGEGGLAVGAGSVVAAQPGGAPADHVERVSFPIRPVDGAIEVEGAGGMARFPPAVTAPS